MLVYSVRIYCRMLKDALHGLNVPMLSSFPQFCRSLKSLEVLIDVVGRTQKRLHLFECVVLHAIERGRCLCTSIDQKIEVQCFWIIGPAHLVPTHSQGGVAIGRIKVGRWQGKQERGWGGSGVKSQLTAGAFFLGLSRTLSAAAVFLR